MCLVDFLVLERPQALARSRPLAACLDGRAPLHRDVVLLDQVIDRRPAHAEQLGGPLGSFFAFGAEFAGGVNVAVGDYDGDGLDDYSVWRPSAMPGQSKFIIRRSTNTGVLLEVFAGEQGDYPVANTRTN